MFSAAGVTPGTEQADEALWTNYEFARFFTSNCCPGFFYFVLAHLVRRGAVRAVVTTNYDQFVNSLSAKTDLPLALNPIGGAARDGYYSTRRNGKTAFWKIHGTLGHVAFRNCSSPWPHLFATPSFLMGFSTRAVRDRYNLRVLHDYVQSQRPCPSYSHDTDTGHYFHFTDNAYLASSGTADRRAFRREIAGAIRDIEKSEGVLAVGFRGAAGEELNQALQEHARRRSLFLFMTTTQCRRSLFGRDPTASARVDGALLRRLAKQGPERLGFYDGLDRDGFAKELAAACGFDAELLYAEYLCDWVNGRLFANPRALTEPRT